MSAALTALIALVAEYGRCGELDGDVRDRLSMAGVFLWGSDQTLDKLGVK